MELNELRNEIKLIDTKMTELFIRRMNTVTKVAKYKLERGIPIEDKMQEKEIIEIQSRLIEDKALREFYIEFLENTLTASKRWQLYIMNSINNANEANKCMSGNTQNNGDNI